MTVRPDRQDRRETAAPFVVSAVQPHVVRDRPRTLVTLSRNPASPPPPPKPPRRPRPVRPSPGPRRSPPARTPSMAPTLSVPPSLRRRRWPAALTLTALALAVAVPLLVQAVLLLVGDDGADDDESAGTPLARVHSGTAGLSGFPATPAADPRTDDRAAAVAWTRSWLPTTAVVAGDRATAQQLRAAGFTSAVTLTSAVPAGVAYVVDVPGARLSGSVVAASVPLVRFGDATVRQVVTGSPAEVLAAVRSDRSARLAGGRELLVNPALTTDGAIRSALRAGELDLRAESVLGILAQKGSMTVQVSQPSRATAEARVSLPIRSVRISTADIDAAEDTLRTLPVGYRPMSVTRLGDNSVRVVWRPAAPAGRVLGN